MAAKYHLQLVETAPKAGRLSKLQANVENAEQNRNQSLRALFAYSAASLAVAGAAVFCVHQGVNNLLEGWRANPAHPTHEQVDRATDRCTEAALNGSFRQAINSDIKRGETALPAQAQAIMPQIAACIPPEVRAVAEHDQDSSYALGAALSLGAIGLGILLPRVFRRAKNYSGETARKKSNLATHRDLLARARQDPLSHP